MNPKNLMRLAVVGLSLLISAGAVAQTGFSSLEERMTGREFRDAGLHKLTDEELAELNRWIRQRSLAEGELPDAQDRDDDRRDAPADDDRGFNGGDDDDERTIRSRLVGSFNGWRGNDIFELENGMVWQQTDGRSFSTRQMENPAVEIKRGMFGGWHLQVEGYNTRARVRRVE